MENILVDEISKLTSLTEEEKQAVKESFPIKTFAKGTSLIKTGQYSKDSFMVIQGCLRKYFLRDGEEVTSAFFIEGDSMVNLLNDQSSSYNLVCVESTTVAIINSDQEAKLYKNYPKFERICRVEFEKMMGHKSIEMDKFINSSPEEKYLNLMQEKPDLLQRVPQYQIASYLGIKPETLSRIRKRLAKN